MMRKNSFLLISALALLMLASCKGTKEASPANVETGSGATTKTVTDQPSEPVADTADIGDSVNLSSCLESCNIVKQDTGLISKDTCRVGCFMNEAKEKKDPDVCISNVSDALMLPACLTAVAEEMGDVKICDRIGADKSDLMRGACYTSVSEKKSDKTVCEGIKDTMMYSGCVGADANE